jgi:hypothetical protein
MKRRKNYDPALTLVDPASRGLEAFERREQGDSTMLMLLIVLLLVLGTSGGYYGHRRWGFGGGASIGFGTILVVLLIAYFARMFR